MQPHFFKEKNFIYYLHICIMCYLYIFLYCSRTGEGYELSCRSEYLIASTTIRTTAFFDCNHETVHVPIALYWKICVIMREKSSSPNFVELLGLCLSLCCCAFLFVVVSCNHYYFVHTFVIDFIIKSNCRFFIWLVKNCSKYSWNLRSSIQKK